MANLPELRENFATGTLEVVNFVEMKDALAAELVKYKGVGVTDDNYSEAKEVRSHLNAAKKALNDRRIELERRYMEPFNVGKNQIAELVKMIDEVSTSIDSGIKSVEEERKLRKKEECLAAFAEMENPYNIPIENVWSDKWLNATTTLTSVKKDISAYFEKVATDIATIASLVEEPARQAKVRTLYLEYFDLNRAIAEEKRLNDLNKKAEEAARNVSPAPAPVVESTPAPAHVDDTLETPDSEVIGTVTFSITGPKSKIMKVRDLIKELGLTMTIVK